MGIKLANLIFGQQRLSDWHRANQATNVRSGMVAEFKEKQTFKCAVYKNGELIGSSTT